MAVKIKIKSQTKYLFKNSSPLYSVYFSLSEKKADRISQKIQILIQIWKLKNYPSQSRNAVRKNWEFTHFLKNWTVDFTLTTNHYT